MNELQINTTQNVMINFNAAGIGERLLAFIIDFAIIFAYLLVMYLTFNVGRLYSGLDGWSQRAMDFIVWIPVIFYTLVQESLFGGKTIGKHLVKIKVVKLDGYQTSFIDFLIRWFFRMIDIYIFGTIGFIVAFNEGLLLLTLFVSPLVGLITIAVSKKAQRFGDMVAGTGVIKLKNEFNISHTILEELKDNYKPRYHNVIKLSDNDARIIKDTFAASMKIRDYVTIQKLRKKIEEVTGDISQESDVDFVRTILKDYNYFTQNM